MRHNMGSSFSAQMRTAGATPEKEAPASIETPCSIRCGWACGSDTPSFFRLSATAPPSSSWAVSSGSNDRSTGASTGRQVITSSRVWATVCLLSAIDTPYAGGTPGCFPKLCNTEDVCSQCYQNAHSGISQRRCKQGCISACRSGSGLADHYAALANTCTWSRTRISRRACVNRLRQKARGRSSKVRAATGQTCLLVLYPDGEPKRRICQAPAVLFYPRSHTTAGVEGIRPYMKAACS